MDILIDVARVVAIILALLLLVVVTTVGLATIWQALLKGYDWFFNPGLSPEDKDEEDKWQPK